MAYGVQAVLNFVKDKNIPRQEAKVIEARALAASRESGLPGRAFSGDKLAYVLGNELKAEEFRRIRETNLVRYGQL